MPKKEMETEGGEDESVGQETVERHNIEGKSSVEPSFVPRTAIKKKSAMRRLTNNRRS